MIGAGGLVATPIWKAIQRPGFPTAANDPAILRRAGVPW